MAERLTTGPSPFDVPTTTPADDGSFTIPKLKAASESLRRFNDALLRIGEAESDAQTDLLPLRPASGLTAKASP